VKRYKAFDPPEYANWKLHPQALRAFRERLGARAVARDVTALPTTLLLRAYDGLLRARLYDITLKRWVMQGVISKAWLGTGEEAVTVGSVLPLEDGDVVGPMIRNAGAAILRGLPLAECFRVYLGTPDGHMRGRDLHVGDFARGVYPPISMVGSFVPVLAGVAYAMKRAATKGPTRVALTWVGDGASRTGEFHEGMSLAATLGVPLVVVLQNNAVALGTRTETHLRGPLEAMAAAYGVPGFECDGNNVIDTYLTARRAVGACRAGKGPALVVATTFRMGSHATHDEAEARRLFSKEVFERWGRRDPIGVYEEWLAAGERDLDAWVAEDGAIREEPAAATGGGGAARARVSARVPAGSRATVSARAPAGAKPVARAARNRAALARVEARATAAIESAADEALASRQKPFGASEATDGVLGSP